MPPSPLKGTEEKGVEAMSISASISHSVHGLGKEREQRAIDSGLKGEKGLNSQNESVKLGKNPEEQHSKATQFIHSGDTNYYIQGSQNNMDFKSHAYTKAAAPARDSLPASHCQQDISDFQDVHTCLLAMRKQCAGRSLSQSTVCECGAKDRDLGFRTSRSRWRIRLGSSLSPSSHTMTLL